MSDVFRQTDRKLHVIECRLAECEFERQRIVVAREVDALEQHGASSGNVNLQSQPGIFQLANAIGLPGDVWVRHRRSRFAFDLRESA